MAGRYGSALVCHSSAKGVQERGGDECARRRPRAPLEPLASLPPLLLALPARRRAKEQNNCSCVPEAENPGQAAPDGVPVWPAADPRRKKEAQLHRLQAVWERSGLHLLSSLGEGKCATCTCPCDDALRLQEATGEKLDILKDILDRRHYGTAPRDAGFSLFVTVNQDPDAEHEEDRDKAERMRLLDVRLYCDIAMMGTSVDAVRFCRLHPRPATCSHTAKQVHTRNSGTCAGHLRIHDVCARECAEQRD